MHDSLLVRCIEGVSDLPRDSQGIAYCNGPVPQSIGKRVPLDELEHQRAHVARIFNAVDRSDVWMIKRGEHPRLAIEARQPLSIRGEYRRQDLDCNIATKLHVMGAVD